MRHNDTNKITNLSFPEMRKIDTFLKPVLSILFRGNLIVGWGEGVIKEGAGILH